MVCMDGASRIRYSQGFPARKDTKTPWLTLSFYMDCTKKSVPIAYERETRTVVMHTPIIPDRVVTTQRLEIDSGIKKSYQPLAMDSLGEALHTMRRHVRAAESHVLLERALARQCGLSSSTGRIGIQEKSSSSKEEE